MKGLGGHCPPTLYVKKRPGPVRYGVRVHRVDACYNVNSVLLQCGLTTLETRKLRGDQIEVFIK